MANQQFLPPPKTVETLDRDKLQAILTKNWPWILVIIMATNLAAYLTLRWTKDIFQSVSEIKLEIKSNVNDLGIRGFGQSENLNLLSGEIEQIRSHVFLNHVIDSLDLGVSYFSVGQVLDDEMFRRSPFMVTYQQPIDGLLNMPIFFSFTDTGFELTVNKKNDPPITGTFSTPVTINGAQIVVQPNPSGAKNQVNEYYFIINSRENLLNFISKNLDVDIINFNANTIRISFQDFNAKKTQAIVNAIDSLYLTYSNQQKNLASTQKIQWLNKELLGMEEKMEKYEDYFKDFTITNRSSNVNDDLKGIIQHINSIDSQRFSLAQKMAALNILIDDITASKFKNELSNQSFLPDYIARKLEMLQVKKREQDRLALAYNENTFAYRQKERELMTLKDQVFEDIQKLKKLWSTRVVPKSCRMACPGLAKNWAIPVGFPATITSGPFAFGQ